MRLSLRHLFTLLTLLSLSFFHPASSTAQLYWIEDERIQTADLDGSNVAEVLAFERNALPSGIAVDAEGGWIYWYEDGSQYIRRARLDGSEATDLFRPEDRRVDDLVIDADNGHVYWGAAIGDGIIGRAALDGSDAEVLLSDADYTEGVLDLALDVKSGKMYWTALGAVRRANLDGTDVEFVADVPFNRQPSSISLDADGGFVYWAEGDEIFRAPMDGGEPESVLRRNRPEDVVVVPAEGKIYWVQGFWANLRAEDPGVFRADLDGGNVEELVLDVMPEALAVVGGDTGTDVDALPQPLSFETSPAYPNPFRDRTQVVVRVDRAQEMTVSVYDMLGRRVAVLHDGPLSSAQTLTLDAAHLPNGVYTIRASGATGSRTRTAVLIR